jgi:hypothetical protein
MADAVGSVCASLDPLLRLVEVHVMAAERLHADDTTVPVLAKGKLTQDGAGSTSGTTGPLVALRQPIRIGICSIGAKWPKPSLTQGYIASAIFV